MVMVGIAPRCQYFVIMLRADLGQQLKDNELS